MRNRELTMIHKTSRRQFQNVLKYMYLSLLQTLYIHEYNTYMYIQINIHVSTLAVREGTHKYDIISEKVPHWRTNSDILDNPFSHGRSFYD